MTLQVGKKYSVTGTYIYATAQVELVVVIDGMHFFRRESGSIGTLDEDGVKRLKWTEIEKRGGMSDEQRKP